MLDCVGSGETRAADDVCWRLLEVAGGVLRKMFLKENDLYGMFGRAEGGGTRVLGEVCCQCFGDAGRILRKGFPKGNDIDDMFDA